MIEKDWMRPALHKSEAVLMPAMGKNRTYEPLFSDRVNRKNAEDTFLPIPSEVTTTALSTYVRPRGSIAGRGILKAAGVSLSPYSTPKQSKSPIMARRGYLAAVRRF